MKKVTMRDIAEETGVSLATVSYVLNNSEKEKISHTTRLKVLEAAKRLNYVPNLTAKSLANQHSNLIGIIISLAKDCNSGLKLLYYDLAMELQQQLIKLGYDCIIATTHKPEDADIIAKRSLEAAFMIDFDSGWLKSFTKKYYVPLIFLDSDNNDSLFFKINPDYTAIVQQAMELLQEDSLFLVMEDIMNQEIKAAIISHFQERDVFINKPNANLSTFLLEHPGKKGIVLGDILGLEVERLIPNDRFLVVSYLNNPSLLLPDTRRIQVRNITKAQAAIHVLTTILNMEYELGNDNKITIQPESI